jgi:prophage tail gpP-like protein
MTPPDLDKVTLVTEDGTEFSLWESVTISDTFLDPCQTMSLSVGADEARFGLTTSIRVGSFFQLLVNGHPQMAGLIDSVEVEASRGGVAVSVTGRDMLSPCVDSNIDPRLAVRKEMGLIELAQLVLVEQFDLPITIFGEEADADTSRSMAVGRRLVGKAKKGKKSPKDPLKDLRPHANEGGFAYLMRFAHRVGHHVWSIPDGSGVILGKPSYEQEAACELMRKRGIHNSGTNIEKGRVASNNTAVPSDVYVWGKGTKPGPKSNPIGYAHNDSAPYFKPFYVTDEESSSKEHCDTVARYVMGKALRNSLTYNCTVRGLSDPMTGAIYNVDTVIDVTDEHCGINGPMWVESRIFRKSRAGTFTDLKLIPTNSLLMDYYANESPPPPPANYQAAQGQIPKKKVSDRELTGFELAYVQVWGDDPSRVGKGKG